MAKNLGKAKQHAVNVDDYLSAVIDDRHMALHKLRNDIRATIPDAQECISYGIPGFRLDGKYLLGFGAARNHCAFYIGSTAQRYRKELKRYDVSKGTIRFQPSEPLPTRLVQKLVKARVRQKRPT